MWAWGEGCGSGVMGCGSGVRGEGGGEGYDEGVWRGFSEARKGEEASGGVQRAACSAAFCVGWRGKGFFERKGDCLGRLSLGWARPWACGAGWRACSLLRGAATSTTLHPSSHAQLSSTQYPNPECNLVAGLSDASLMPCRACTRHHTLPR